MSICFVDDDHDHVLDWTDDGDGIWETSDGGDDRPISIFKYQNNVFGERVNADEKLFSGVGNSITPSRENFQWEYDSVGRLSKESYQSSSSPSLNYVTLYQYDLAGNRTRTLTDKNLNGQFDDSGDTITTYTYDHNDRLLTETKDVLGGNGDGDTYTEHFYSVAKLSMKEESKGLPRNDSAMRNSDPKVIHFRGNLGFRSDRHTSKSLGFREIRKPEELFESPVSYLGSSAARRAGSTPVSRKSFNSNDLQQKSPL